MRRNGGKSVPARGLEMLAAAARIDHDQLSACHCSPSCSAGTLAACHLVIVVVLTRPSPIIACVVPAVLRTCRDKPASGHKARAVTWSACMA